MARIPLIVSSIKTSRHTSPKCPDERRNARSESAFVPSPDSPALNRTSPCQRREFLLGSPRHRAAVAQLVRAPDCGSGGRRFESTQLYHSKINNLSKILQILVRGAKVV